MDAARENTKELYNSSQLYSSEATGTEQVQNTTKLNLSEELPPAIARAYQLLSNRDFTKEAQDMLEEYQRVKGQNDDKH